MGPDRRDTLTKVFEKPIKAINPLCKKEVTLTFPSNAKKPQNQPPPGWKHKQFPSLDLKCSYCPKKFARHKRLKKHQRKHESLNYRFCPVCHKDFRTIEAMQEHIEIWHEIYKYQSEMDANATLPKVVPSNKLATAKSIYRQKFWDSFPRL